jgi:hypothetical protein
MFDKLMPLEVIVFKIGSFQAHGEEVRLSH